MLIFRLGVVTGKGPEGESYSTSTLEDFKFLKNGGYFDTESYLGDRGPIIRRRRTNKV